MPPSFLCLHLGAWGERHRPVGGCSVSLCFGCFDWQLLVVHVYVTPGLCQNHLLVPSSQYRKLYVVNDVVAVILLKCPYGRW